MKLPLWLYAALYMMVMLAVALLASCESRKALNLGATGTRGVHNIDTSLYEYGSLTDTFCYKKPPFPDDTAALIGEPVIEHSEIEEPMRICGHDTSTMLGHYITGTDNTAAIKAVIEAADGDLIAPDTTKIPYLGPTHTPCGDTIICDWDGSVFYTNPPSYGGKHYNCMHDIFTDSRCPQGRITTRTIDGYEWVASPKCTHIWTHVVSDARDTIEVSSEPVFAHSVYIIPPEYEPAGEIVCVICHKRKRQIIHNIRVPSTIGNSTIILNSFSLDSAFTTDQSESTLKLPAP